MAFDCYDFRSLNLFSYLVKIVEVSEDSFIYEWNHRSYHGDSKGGNDGRNVTEYIHFELDGHEF